MLRRQLRQDRVVIPYLTFGDDSPALTRALVLAADQAGAAVIELGLPFSDPVADGPVIQASHYRALEKNPGISVDDAFQLVAELSPKITASLVFMSSVNLVMQYGIAAFFKRASETGLEGVIIPDLSIEEAAPYRREAKRYKVALIFLVSPLCADDRLRKIVKASEGFVYLMSTTGTTGERAFMAASLSDMVEKIKAIKNIPVAIGFGVSTPDHIRFIHEIADGAIIGSHLIRQLGTFLPDREKAVAAIHDRIKDFVTA